MRGHEGRDGGQGIKKRNRFDRDDDQVGWRVGVLGEDVGQFEGMPIERGRVRLVAGPALGIDNNPQAIGIARDNLGGVQGPNGTQADQCDMLNRGKFGGCGIHGF